MEGIKATGVRAVDVGHVAKLAAPRLRDPGTDGAVMRMTGTPSASVVAVSTPSSMTSVVLPAPATLAE
jgi:hypothetical protein